MKKKIYISIVSTILSTIFLPQLYAQVVDITLCYNQSFTATLDEYHPSWNYLWRQSNDGTVWSSVETNTPSFNLAAVNENIYIQCLVDTNADAVYDSTAYYATLSVLSTFAPGSIEGDTTVCYNTSGGTLTMTADATGGLAPYSYQWQRSTNGTSWTNVSGATQTQYTTPNLTADTYYRLKYISGNGCDPVYSNTVTVNVYADITAATIATATTQTICYDSVPTDIHEVTAPTGADGSFTYQWQQNDGSGWDNISGATTNAYQPSNLRADHSYRLVTASTYGCGSRTSQAVTINVYDRINSGTIGSDQLICYNSTGAMSFTATPTGGGDSYSYQWQRSDDSQTWSDIAAATATTYTTPGLDDTAFFRVVVTSTLGCFLDTTNTVQVSVLQQFLPGTISDILDSVCYSYKPGYTIDMTTDATGGMRDYSYQWQMTTDTLQGFENAVHGSDATSYSPDELYETTYYRLSYISDHDCGTVYSNIHTIKVNPLPPIYDINGESATCLDQYETYFIEGASSDYSYEWSTAEYTGETDPLSDLADTIEILWQQPGYTDTVQLLATDLVTQCYNMSRLAVTISSETAPDRTTIIHKPNSDILIARENAEICYQWGYTDKQSGQIVEIENSNRRYVLLPIPFDSTRYDYWVELRMRKESPCYSVSFYNPMNDTLIVMPTSFNMTASSKGNGVVGVRVSNPERTQYVLAVYTIDGRPVLNYIPPDNEWYETELNLVAGVYLVTATHKDGRISNKIIVR